MKSAFTLLGTFIFLLGITASAYAQTTVIEVDSVTGAPSAALPFDQPFVLKIPTKSQQVFSVTYVQNAGRQNLANSLNRREPRANKHLGDIVKYNKILKLENLVGPDNDFEIKKVGTNNYLLIRIRGNHLLNPGKLYTFFWNEDAGDTIIKLFDQYAQYIRSNRATDFLAALITYQAIAAANRKTLGVEAGLPTDYLNLNTLEPIRTVYDDYLHNHLSINYPLLYTKINNYKTGVNSLTVSDIQLSEESLRVLLQEISQHSHHLETTLKTIYLPKLSISSQRILNIIDLDSTRWHKVLLGYQTLDCTSCKATDQGQYETRFTNIKSSLSGLEELLLIARAVQNNQPMLNDAANSLAALVLEVRSKAQEFEKIVDLRKAIKADISPVGLADIHQVGGSTVIANFESRTKFSITPDFGLVTTRIGNDGSNPYGFLPYLGFQVNLRPLNRDIAFWKYRHKPLHYASVMLGYTQVTIDNGPKQSAGVDSIASFFKKGTLITGAGLRLGNAVRLTGGLMWYFQYNPVNATTKPIVYDRRRLQNWPFVGVSVDLSLTTLLNGIADITTGVSRRFTPTPSAP